MHVCLVFCDQCSPRWDWMLSCLMHSLSQLCCPSQLTFFLYVSNWLHNKVEEAWWAFLFALSFSSIRNAISPLVVRANNQLRCPSGEKNTLGSNELHQHQRQVTMRRVEGLWRAKQVAEICNKSSLLLCSVDFKKAKWNACSHECPMASCGPSISRVFSAPF